MTKPFAMPCQMLTRSSKKLSGELKFLVKYSSSAHANVCNIKHGESNNETAISYSTGDR